MAYKSKAREASALVRKAYVKGLIDKQPCEKCGEKNAHAHHEDYDKPLEVTWLCHKCHRERHQEINEENGKIRRNSKKTHCPKGHEYTEENTYLTKQGWRQCKTCKANRGKYV